MWSARKLLLRMMMNNGCSVLFLEGFEWILPAGKITPVIGQPIYVSAMGEHLSHDAYLEMYNIDPEIAYNMMRRRISKRTARQVNKQSV